MGEIRKTAVNLMDIEKQKDIDNYLDSAILKFEKRQKKSFWKVSILSAVIVLLIGVLLYMIISTIDEKNSTIIDKNSTIESKDRDINSQKSIATELEKTNNDKAELLNKLKIIDEIDENQLPESLKNEFQEAKIALSNALTDRNVEMGDTLYVWAESGLSLRNRPNTKRTSIIGSVNYGDPVVVSAFNGLGNHIDKLTINDNFDILLTGTWREIAYDTIIFDAYLSRLPFFKSNNSIKDYINKINRKFNGRIALQIIDVSNKETTLKTSGLDFNEVLLLIKHLYKFDENLSAKLVEKTDENYSIQTSNQKIVIKGKRLNYDVAITEGRF